MELDKTILKGIVRRIAHAHDDEIDCDQCFEVLDRFAELKLAGKRPAEALPLVEEHLQNCRYCREEFEALLTALQALA
jgi:predicted anti-sigma-YlaC factor YlaD